jgi:hypothetical protein
MDELPNGRTSVRLPPDLRKAIDDEAWERRMTVTELIIEKLSSVIEVAARAEREDEPGFFD